jgi:hypothetical protein
MDKGPSSSQKISSHRISLTQPKGAFKQPAQMIDSLIIDYSFICERIGGQLSL